MPWTKRWIKNSFEIGKLIVTTHSFFNYIYKNHFLKIEMVFFIGYK